MLPTLFIEICELEISLDEALGAGKHARASFGKDPRVVGVGQLYPPLVEFDLETQSFGPVGDVKRHLLSLVRFRFDAWNDCRSYIFDLPGDLPIKLSVAYNVAGHALDDVEGAVSQWSGDRPVTQTQLNVYCGSAGLLGARSGLANS